MKLLVMLRCTACRSWTRMLVPGRQCEHSTDHVHVEQTGKIEEWYASHHQPGMEVVGHIEEA